MRSLIKMRTTVLLASAALLCTAPLAAATRSKLSSKPKARTAVTSSRPVDSSRTSKASSRQSSSLQSTKMGAASKTSVAATRHAGKAKLHTVAFTAAKPKFHGQQSIDQMRTMEIQQALIREHYLDGEATGEWNQATRDALIRFQSDNHWQTKVLPDARALIKLGLGPSQQNLLNPESAVLAPPYQSGIEKASRGGSN